MLRTIVWYSYFWAFMFLSLFLYVPVALLSFQRIKAYRSRYVRFIVGIWSRSLIRLAGGNIELKGVENLPETDRVCYVSNHQGAFDIPIILGFLPGPVGFIAKKELALLPIVNLWMFGIGCVFINRENRRAALLSIKKGIDKIQQGNPMVIFPEGTRSQGPEMNPFHPGSLKLATRAGAHIVPVTISGSYQLREQEGRIHPGKVIMTVHRPIPKEEYNALSSGELSSMLFTTINSGI